MTGDVNDVAERLPGDGDGDANDGSCIPLELMSLQHHEVGDDGVDMLYAAKRNRQKTGLIRFG